ncbi:hypothetical protein GCM10023091_10900 [Ravibacter arvi]|uniref:Glycoside hydrolase family 5 domain-containing protein n=1 Tax=Ravibacter arvi TaxID=2051041 RepID=A0ABP8LTQ9_9BACT
MKPSCYLFFFLIMAGAVSYPASAVDISATLPTSAGDRSYLIHAPGTYVSRNLPVVFVLHGDGGTGALIKSYSGFDHLADSEQFMAVYPTAQGGSWSRAKGDLKDIYFIASLLDYLCQVYQVNTAKVYVTGHSAGGFMAYNLGMSLPGRIAAIAPVAGNMYAVNGYNWNDFFSSPAFRSIPVLHIHGDADGTVAYPDPNHMPDPWGEWPLSSLAYYTCGQDTYGLSQQELTPSGSVKKLVFCNAPAELSLVRIVGGGHGWPDVADWEVTGAIWDFFKNRATDGTAPCQSELLQAAHHNIIDPCGYPFVPRGVNYSLLDDWDFPANLAAGEKSAQIIKANPNLVRIQWYADYGQSGRPGYNLADLDEVITRFRNAGIVSMVGLWDLTCSNDYSRFSSVITPWWQRADVLALIEKHRSFLMINPANEFGNVSWAGNPAAALNTWTTHYKNVVTALRSAGIRTPIVIDAPDCGTSLQPLLDRGNELQNHDPLHNLVFSVHGYWAENFYQDSQLSDFVQHIADANVPIMLGEVANYQSDAQPCQYAIHLDHLLTRAQEKNVGWLAWTWFKDYCSDRQISPSGEFSGLSAYGNRVINNVVYGLSTHAVKMNTQCLEDPLPVSLAAFDPALAENRRSVRVSWKTTAEQSFSHFVLERGRNPGELEPVVRIPGRGPESESLRTYRWVDIEPGTGVLYYRLRMVDHDGTASLSLIRSVTVPGTRHDAFDVGPVPASDAFFLLQDQRRFPAEISVTDARGILIFNRMVGSAGEPVNIADLTPGVYFVRVKGIATARRIIVVR